MKISDVFKKFFGVFSLEEESNIDKPVTTPVKFPGFSGKILNLIKKIYDKFINSSASVKVLYACIIGLLLVFLNDLISLTILLCGVGLLIFAILTIIKLKKEEKK